MAIYYGKYKILNSLISACDPEYVLSSITQSIKKKSSLVIAPVASHPVVFSLFDIDYQRILNSFDLVISDIRMPGKNGVEAIRAIRRQCDEKIKKDIPIIFITGYAEMGDQLKAEHLGEIILKPFDLNRLIMTIREYL